MPKSPQSQPFELKGSLYPMTALRLTGSDAACVGEALTQHVARAPGFLKDAPIVIDLSRLDAMPDLDAMRRAALDAGLRPVGVAGPQKGLREAAKVAQLAVFSGREAKSATPLESPPPTATRPRIVKQTVRSGQQIYAQGADLIVLASVNRDAEVLADGHVHIYGSLKGKAIAGVQGDAAARIFAQALDPQLASVAGIYSAGEDLQFDFRGRPGQVWLEGSRLRIEAL